MKRFIPAFAIILMALFFSTKVSAQSDPATRQAEMKQKLITDLKMTPVQADSVVSINSSYMPQRREIFQDQSLSQDQKMAKMKDITAEADKRIQPILGDSLYKQYQDWRMKNMQQMRGGRSGNN
jgi:hypothetical protein